MMEVLAPLLGATSSRHVSAEIVVPWERHLAEMRQLRLAEPFAPSAIEFVHQLSQAILLIPAMRRYPELLAMAHWLRKANILALADTYRLQRLRIGRGIVLHFAPSNVDSIFIYSWMISLLMGNANVVRLSQRRGEQVEVLIRIIAELLEKPVHEALRARSLLVSYAHDDQLTEALSAACQMRVIWGGDETIRRIRAIPLNPLATEIAFADRFSLVALQADMVVALAQTEFERLLQNFYNDAFWFDQMACSSPRLTVWLGEAKDVERARARFWQGLADVIRKKGYESPAAIGIRRLTTAYHFASLSEGTQLPLSNSSSEDEGASEVEGTAYVPTRVQVPQLTANLREQHCGGGLFVELHCPNLADLSAHLSQKDQTLSYFGIAREALQAWVWTLPQRSIDRIVPVGQALSFSPVWDGHDLFVAFTREVTVE
jgi:hypothetical protein